MQATDLALRDKLLRRGELNDGYHPKMERVHRQNAAQLDIWLDQSGFPTVEQVGAAASEAAWLIVQHAIGQPAFMKKALRLFEKAVTAGQADAKLMPYLSDRIAVFSGQPQLFGTQFDWDDTGQLSPQQYDDLTAVNQRRHELGWNSLEAQTALMRKRAAMENNGPPADLLVRRTAYDAWRKRVGWIQ